MRIKQKLTMPIVFAITISFFALTASGFSIGRKVNGKPSTLPSPIKISVGDNISSCLVDSDVDDCYSFTIKSKTKFNIFVRRLATSMNNCYLVKSSNMSSIVKCGINSTDFSRYIIPSSRRITRFIKNSKYREDGMVYNSLSPGSYSICFHAYTMFDIPFQYSCVTFLGDLSKNPWKGKYTLLSDSATGLGYSKHYNKGSSTKPNIGAQWEKERQEEEERQRRINLDRHNHGLPHN